MCHFRSLAEWAMGGKKSMTKLEIAILGECLKRLILQKIYKKKGRGKKKTVVWVIILRDILLFGTFWLSGPDYEKKRYKKIMKTKFQIWQILQTCDKRENVTRDKYGVEWGSYYPKQMSFDPGKKVGVFYR